MNLLTGWVLCSTLAAIPASSHAACCYLNGNTGTCITGPIQYNPGQAEHDFGGGGLCGQSVSGPGCVIEVKQNVSSASANECLTIARGVKVEALGHTFTCTSNVDCGAAIAVYGAGTGTTTVDQASFIGNWRAAADNDTGAAASATDVNIDGATIGIAGFSTITRAVVANASFGVELTTNGASITDSLIANCSTAVLLNASNTKLVNGLLKSNTFNVDLSTGGKIESQGSSIEDAAGWAPYGTPIGGHCGPLSDEIDDCMTFGGSRVSFVNDQLR